MQKTSIRTRLHSVSVNVTQFQTLLFATATRYRAIAPFLETNANDPKPCFANWRKRCGIVRFRQCTEALRHHRKELQNKLHKIGTLFQRHERMPAPLSHPGVNALISAKRETFQKKRELVECCQTYLATVAENMNKRFGGTHG